MENIWSEYADAISGVWKCVSFEMFDGTGPDKTLIAKPHGDNPLGRASISPKGWLSAHLARPERMHRLRSGKPWQTAPDKEVAYVARGLSMYCGYLQLFKDDDGNLFWQTKVEIASDPGWMGGLQERKVTLSEEGGKQYMVLEPVEERLSDVCVPHLTPDEVAIYAVAAVPGQC